MGGACKLALCPWCFKLAGIAQCIFEQMCAPMYTINSWTLKTACIWMEVYTYMYKRRPRTVIFSWITIVTSHTYLRYRLPQDCKYAHCARNYLQLFAPNLPAQLADSKQNCLHCGTTSMGLGTFVSTATTHKNILLSASQARLLQSAVSLLITHTLLGRTIIPRNGSK